jgi:DNA-binding GntR family transcriptional regulator
VKPKESVKQTQPKKPEYTFTPKSEQRTSRGNERTQERTTSIVEDLEEDIAQGIEFDARKAIIYSEILRRPDF